MTFLMEVIPMCKLEKYRDILLEEFYLDSESNIRRSKDGYLNRFKKGDLAKFFVDSNGYYRCQMPQGIRTTISMHQLMWLLHGNDVPAGMELDHINGNRADNSISNLRIVDRRLNNRNRKKRSDNTSGITGIRWSEHHQHYVIRRTIDNKRLSRSRKTLEEAIQVLEELKLMDDSYSQRHGK